MKVGDICTLTAVVESIVLFTPRYGWNQDSRQQDHAQYGVIYPADWQKISRYGPYRVLTRSALDKTIRCLYLGQTYRQYGAIEPRSSEDPGLLAPDGSLTLAVVQPIDAKGRYRKPLLALPEDIGE